MHLAIAAGGGVFLYAALRGVSPLQALKDVTSGSPPAVSTEGKKITTASGDLDPNYVPGGGCSISASPRPGGRTPRRTWAPASG